MAVENFSFRSICARKGRNCESPAWPWVKWDGYFYQEKLDVEWGLVLPLQYSPSCLSLQLSTLVITANSQELRIPAALVSWSMSWWFFLLCAETDISQPLKLSLVVSTILFTLLLQKCNFSSAFRAFLSFLLSKFWVSLKYICLNLYSETRCGVYVEKQTLYFSLISFIGNYFLTRKGESRVAREVFS